MRSGPSRQTLRCVAAGTMFIDHIGVALFPGVLWLRCVGRLAFPIFAFFLAEGQKAQPGRKRRAVGKQCLWIATGSQTLLVGDSPSPF